MSNLNYHKTMCIEFPDEVEIKLFEIFKKLNKEYGATYMSYTHDRFDKVRYSFRTDQKWAGIYHRETINDKPIIEQCPLDIVSRQKNNIFILWDFYIHRVQPKIFREIMGMREDVGMTHGLTLSTYFGEHHDALAIATEDHRNDIASKIMVNNTTNIIKESLLECRRLTLKNIKNENNK